MARERYYVGQYGYFYSFSKAGLIAFFEAAIANDGCYELPSCAEVSQRPKGVHNSDSGYWSSMTGPDGRFYQPLDWDVDAFKDAVATLSNS